MSTKKFMSVNGKVDTPDVITDYENAKMFEKLRVGKLGVYYNEGLRTRYFPYDYIEKAFLRIHEVNGKLCCGSTVFQYFRLVFVHDGKESADYICENEKAMRDALNEISVKAPQVKIGFKT